MKQNYINPDIFVTKGVKNTGNFQFFWNARSYLNSSCEISEFGEIDVLFVPKY